MTDPQGNTMLDASTIVLLAALVFGLYRQGAYHESEHLTFAVLVVVAGVLRLSSAAGRRALRTSALVAVPLVGVSLLSLLAADDRTDAASTFGMIGLCGVATAVGLGSRPQTRRLTVDVVLAAITIVAVTAIHGVAAHSLPWGRVTGDVWRGSSSITYANGAAAGLLVALALSLDRAARNGSRWHAVGATFALVALLATQSRAALFVVVVAAAVFVLRDRFGDSVRVLWPVGVGAALGASAMIRFASVSATPQPLLVWIVVAMGCGLTGVLWPHRHRIIHPGRLFAALSVVASVAVAMSPLRGRITISSATTASGPGGSVVFGDRGRLWSTAWERFLERPLLGHGPGNVELRWTESGRTFEALFVHNEFLELLVTHGIAGLAALVAAGCILNRGANRSAKPGLIAAATVFLAHSVFDFLWHVPVLPVLASLLVGLAFAGSEAADPAEAKTQPSAETIHAE